MLKKTILDGLNKQIQLEFNASHAYLGMSAWFDQQVLKGFAKYFRKQAGEERTHALKLLDYVLDRNAEVVLGPVDPAKTTFATVLDALKAALEAERNNTASINALLNLAIKENDLATQNVLQWFVNEQVEEEKWAEELVTLAEKLAGHAPALFMLDHRVEKMAEKD
jgi:ferritin